MDTVTQFNIAVSALCGVASFFSFICGVLFCRFVGSKKKGAEGIPLPAPADLRNRESGSVFTVLLAGVAMAGALGLVLSQTISGPMSSMVRITNKTSAKSQMQSVSSIVIMDAANSLNLPMAGDCDGDGSVEPRAWRAPVGPVGSYPAGGGLLPSIGAPMTDPWGTDYGYCVWDIGSNIKDAGCDGADSSNARRLDGSPTPSVGSALTQTVIAVISAGPDRHFDSSCYNYIDGAAAHDVITAAGDDIILRYTYAEAATATSGLWTLKPSDATQAIINKDLAIGPTATPAVTVGATSGLISAAAVTTTGKVIASGGVTLGWDDAGDTGTVKNADCTALTIGLVRYNTTSHKMETCNGATWDAAGGATTLDSLTDAYTDYTTDHNLILAGNPTTSAALASGAQHNLFIGELAGATTAHSTAATDDNTAIGYKALTALTTGNDNIAIGLQALLVTTQGANNIAIGNNALKATTSGDASVAIGSSALAKATVGHNTAVGYTALANSTTGIENVAVGYQALNANTTGGDNTALGWDAGLLVSTGSQNTIIGSLAGITSTTVGDVTAVGYKALTLNTGGGNTAVGSQALAANSTAGNNTAVGYSALYSNTTKQESTAVGFDAMYYADSAAGGAVTYNTAVGAYALRGSATAASNTGINNTAVGHSALIADTSGGDNTALGYEAGLKVTTGAQNTIIGSLAGITSTTVGDVTAVGYGALTLNTAAQNTAVGSQALATNAAGTDQTAVGYGALNAATGGDNTGLGYKAGLKVSTGTYNTAIGSLALSAATTATHNTAVGYSALTNATGGDNTALGYNTGSTLTTGASNILIGSGADVPTNSTSSWLNIGGTIYGDLANHAIAIGSGLTSIDNTHAVLDASSATTSIRLPNGTTAQRPTCDASHKGMERFSTTITSMEFCDGTNWLAPITSSSGGTPPTAPAGSGYFVMTAATYDGNLGGRAGANAKCLTELTTNTNWNGYNTANANGQLVAGKVFASICDASICNNALPLTTYAFATVNNPGAGGATFTTDVSGNGPCNASNWGAGNYFSTSQAFWSGRVNNSGLPSCGGVAAWITSFINTTSNCNSWTLNSAAWNAVDGQPANTTYWRFDAAYVTCDQPHTLVCFVNP